MSENTAEKAINLAERLIEQLAAKDARIAELLTILTNIEWVASGLDIAHGIREGWCPECHNNFTKGHKDGCVLGFELNKLSESLNQSSPQTDKE